MAKRTLNRRELRQQADAAEQSASATAATEVAVIKKTKKPAVKRKPRAKKAPPRMCARWGVFDGSMKQVAIFDYNQRGAADEKIADLQSRKKGVYFLQIVKEAMPEPVEAVSVESEV